MKTHELKLDIRYFDDVKSGKKNFEIRKNDSDFKVGDILELKAYVNGLKSFAKWGEIIDTFNNFRMSHNYMTCAEEEADAIKVRIKWMSRHLDDYNKLLEDAGLSFSSESVGLTLAIESVINDYFHTNTLPDGYVVLGVDLVKVVEND